MTAPTWEQIKEHVAAALRGALASQPNLPRARLVRWARSEARKGAEVPRLRPLAAREIDRLVDSAIAAGDGRGGPR